MNLSQVLSTSSLYRGAAQEGACRGTTHVLSDRTLLSAFRKIIGLRVDVVRESWGRARLNRTGSIRGEVHARSKNPQLYTAHDREMAR